MHRFRRGFQTPPAGDGVGGGGGYSAWRCTNRCQVIIPMEVRPLAQFLLEPTPVVLAPEDVEFCSGFTVLTVDVENRRQRCDHDRFLLGPARDDIDVDMMNDVG